MSTITSKNPYTNEINATFETLTNEELDTVIAKAHTAYLSWKDTPRAEKKHLMLRLADIIENDLDACAKFETIEMGRLYGVAVKGVQWTVNLIRRNANNFESILANETISPLVKEGWGEIWLTGHIQYDPLGVIYGIAPWNFPFNQLLRAAVPNILAGNTVIYKHASNVPLCGQKIGELFAQAGFPEWVYTNIFISSSQSEQIIAHPAVAGVNLTGGEKAGSVIGSLAGKYLKPSVLELGGNDAFLVLDHADTDSMVAQAVACRISNGGQRCNSSKRFIVLDKYYDAFCTKMADSMSKLVIGDPMDPSTQISSLATPSLVAEVHAQVTSSIAQGAKCLTGWTIIDEARNIYAPTVLADVTAGMTSYQEEVFWPVASIIRSGSIDDSIAIANHNDLALSAAVFGDDIEQCRQVATRLEWGMIFINQAPWSKASLPMGWVKKSGYGKENGPDGLKSFTNRKVVLY